MSDTKERPVPWGRFVKDNVDTFPSRSTAAWLQRNAEENGLVKCGALRKVQGRWYVWPAKFWAWFAAGDKAAA